MGRAHVARLATSAAAASRAGGVPLVVGVLTTSYPRFAGDYAGCFVEDNVKELLAAGHQVEVFAAGDDPVADPVTQDGALTIWRIPPSPVVSSLFYGDGAPEALERGGLAALGVWVQAAAFWGSLCQALRRRAQDLDTLVAHWLVPSAAIALTVTPGLPLRAYAHSGDVALLERLPGGRALARWIARPPAAGKATDLVFVTSALRRRFAALAGRSVGRVQPLTAPADLFCPATAANRGAARRHLGVFGPTVIAVGRLVPIKGFDLLLSACAQLAGDPRGPPHLVIIGDGPGRRRLEQRARRLGVPLTMPGWVPRAQVADWLHAADLYAQPSLDLPSGRTEGLPVAVLEALAVGLPVVATRVGGLPELAAENPAISLVLPGDVGALGRALACHLAASGERLRL